ncbi:MAG TPA: hypothetical protein VMZ28_27810 [Kofleriaceae bacterium]|nr:hypothetical protein [Kofleriaceae bacterium]
MSDPTDAETFAEKVVDTMGATEALLMAMRLVLLVGQRADPQNPEIVTAAGEAVSAIKRVGRATGALTQA